MAAILNYQRWQSVKIANLISNAYLECFDVFNSLSVAGSLLPIENQSLSAPGH